MTAAQQHFVVQPAEAGVRLDQFLAARQSDLSRARAQALIEGDQVRLDGRSPKASQRLKAGQRVELTVPEAAPALPQAEALPLSVIFEDRDLLVLDKAAGMVVHPGAGHATGTLVNALLHHVKDLRGVGGELRPGIVHRLDKDTSGLLVIAKHDRSLRALQERFKGRTIEKTYLALVLGQPADEGTFQTLHARHPTQRLKFTGKGKTGKRAITHYRVTARALTAARVEIALETGRTHQIRMHFAEAGFPLLGDALYGGKRAQQPQIIGRQALHAYRLAFTHPRTDKPLRFEAQPPQDFVAAERALGLTARR